MPRTFSIEVAKDYFNFASAHFLIFVMVNENLHGNYQVSVKMEGEPIRRCSTGFIPSPIVKQVCDALDHRTMIQTASPVLKVRRRAKEVEVVYRKQRILLPRSDVILLPLANTSTELLAEHVAGKIRRQVRLKFPKTRIRSMEVGVEEARGRDFFAGNSRRAARRFNVPCSKFKVRSDRRAIVTASLSCL
jgi:6-pyruvoyltetrahydropterin/6-carboxytetrahydropterin synthase